MGAWGLGPFESDVGAGLKDSIGELLDEAFGPLREGARDAAVLERAREAAELVEAFGDAAIDVVPDDIVQLLALPGLPRTIVEPLSREPAATRPPFGSAEGSVEAHLRTTKAPYELWNWSAQFGDDRAAAWAACEDPAHLLAFARAYGVSQESIRRDRDALCAFSEAIDAAADERSAPRVQLLSLIGYLAAGRAFNYRGQVEELVPNLPQRLRERIVLP